MGCPRSRLDKHWQMLGMDDYADVVFCQAGSDHRIKFDDAKLLSSHVLVRVSESRLELRSMNAGQIR